jgi:hypothetical protein
LLKFLLGQPVTPPPYGLDAKRYWNEEMVAKFHDYIVSLGLDRDGQEGYVTVAPRSDINMELHSALMGNNSYAGCIPGWTPAYSSALVVRDLLYPALIYANPGKDVTTSAMINYPEGGNWKLNNGKTYTAYSSREVKKAFSSHFRTYDGHSLWKRISNEWTMVPVSSTTQAMEPVEAACHQCTNSLICRSILIRFGGMAGVDTCTIIGRRLEIALV